MFRTRRLCILQSLAFHRVHDDGPHIHNNYTDYNTKQNQRYMILLECCERILFDGWRGKKHSVPRRLLIFLPCNTSPLGLSAFEGRQRGAS